MSNRKIKKYFIVSVIGLFFLPIFCFSKSAHAIEKLPKDTLQTYSKNNILYYNPLGSSDCYSSSASLSAGNTYEEKIWNYFVNLNIAGLSDNAAVIAGIMGNLKQESEYDPFVCNGQGYCGMWQGDTVSYKTFLPIKNQVTNTVGDSYWFDGLGKVESHPQEQTETAITIELDALTKNSPDNDYYDEFQKFISHLGDVSNKTPSSYAELFQVVVEKGVCVPGHGYSCEGYSQAITDNGVSTVARNYYGSLWPSSGYWYQGMQDRMQLAEEIYNQYASSTPTVSETPTTSGDCYHSASESFTRYDQKDDKYKNDYYDSTSSGGQKSSVYASGCGPFSFAMLANALGVRNIDPIEVTNVAGNGGMHQSGSIHTITKYLANHYEMTYEQVNTGYSDGVFGNTLSDDEVQKVADIISSYLKQGWMIHTSGKSSSSSTQGLPFTSGGHYIGIRGITADGKWLLADSNGSAGEENSFREWDPIEVIKNGMNIGNVHAIKASTSSTCGNLTTSILCGNSSQNLVSGGMTLEQAKEYMSNYRKLAKENPGKTNSIVTQYNINQTTCSGGSLYNCVAFTQYFIATNTTAGSVGGLPNGKDVVNKLINIGRATDGGHTPQVYAVFSRSTGGGGYGHTGIVLGITDTDIIVGQADCYGGASGIKASTISLSTATSDIYTYAYLTDLNI